MTDSAIVDLFLARNEEAITKCDNKYGLSLRSFGKRLTHDIYVTEECVDDTYMKTWETVPPKEPRDYLFAYLSKIMRNKCIDRLKSMDRLRRGATVTVLSDELSDAAPSGESSDSLAIENELTALIEEFLRDIKQESREIFILRYFYFEELIDIARHLDITVGKVKTVLKRTRDALREHLEAHGYHA